MIVKERLQQTEMSTSISNASNKYKAESNLNTHRKTAIIVGILFIIATVMLFVGSTIYDPILSSADYLDSAYPNKINVIVGILLEFTKVPAILLIPVFLFPILRKHNEAFALGYVGFRFLEAVLLTIVDINKLSLVSVSQDYLNSGGIDASYFQYMGSSIQAVNDWTFSIYIVVFTLGGLIFYSALYSAKLIPRFISAWGFIAAAILLTGIVLVMADMFAGFSELGVEIVLVTPIAVQEMVMAIWLIVKGFNPAAIEPAAIALSLKE